MVCWWQHENTASYHLQMLDVGAGSILTDSANPAHHKTIAMLLKENTVSRGQAAFHIKDRAWHAQSVDTPPSALICVS
jgi:hypothetical protein